MENLETRRATVESQSKMSDRLADTLLKPLNPSIIIILGLYTLVWGFWLISPFWSVFDRASLYKSMSEMGPEWGWGLVAILSGLVIIRGATKPSYSNLIAGSSVSFGHWFIISIFYFMGDWQNTGGITSAAFSAYSAIIYLNIKVNHDHFKTLGI